MTTLILLACLFQSPTATKQDYADTVKIYESYAARINNPDFWKKVRVDTDDARGVVDFDKIEVIEQRTFVYMMAARLTAEGERLQKKWDDELKKFEGDSYKPKDEKVAGRDDVRGYSAKLLDARKKMAAELEKFISASKKDMKGLVNDYEIQEMEKRVRKTHEKMKLVEKR